MSDLKEAGRAYVRGTLSGLGIGLMSTGLVLQHYERSCVGFVLAMFGLALNSLMHFVLRPGANK